MSRFDEMGILLLRGGDRRDRKGDRHLSRPGGALPGHGRGVGFVPEEVFLLPLAQLALGRAWEAAGEPDSAAHAYGRFVRLWNQADTPQQVPVREARDALVRLGEESTPASSPRHPEREKAGTVP